MPVYGTPKPGFNKGASSGLNLADVGPGASLTLFDGTETPEAGLASIAFARGTQGSGDNGASFFAYGMPADMVIDVQGSNDDIDGHYTSTGTQLTADANGNAGQTDIGRAAFYRVQIATASEASPALMPVVTVQR